MRPVGGRENDAITSSQRLPAIASVKLTPTAKVDEMHGRNLVVPAAFAVCLLAGGIATVNELARSVPAPRPRASPQTEDPGRPARIVAALEDGFPPSLIRNLEEAVGRGLVDPELVASAAAKEKRSRANVVLQQVRSGDIAPGSVRGGSRELVQAGLLTDEQLLQAWRAGREERARALVEDLEATPYVRFQSLHRFTLPTERVPVESVLSDARLSANERARAIGLWEDHMSHYTIAHLRMGALIQGWEDHLDRGLVRDLFSEAKVRMALYIADGFVRDDYGGTDDGSLPTVLWNRYRLQRRPPAD
jgi:hypothetical protein